MNFKHIRPEYIEPGPDFDGLHILLMQAGPNAYMAAIQTEWGEELGRTPRPHVSPFSALALALDSIAASKKARA